MKKQDVIDMLASVKRTRDAFTVVKRTHEAEVATAMRRLVMEAAVNYMSPEEIAQVSGYTVKVVRLMLRSEGLDPRMKKPMLSKHSARTLAENAALLNLDERDLMLSPLAYLPAGDALRQQVQERSVSKVTEIEPELLQTDGGSEEVKREIERLTTVFQEAWNAANERGEIGHRTEQGIRAVMICQIREFGA